MIDTAALKNRILALAVNGQVANNKKDVKQLYDSLCDNAYKIDKNKVSDKNYDLSELPFEIPDNWKWVWLGDIFQHNTGKALNSSNTEGTPLEYITTSNLYWDRFELEELKTMLFKDSEMEKCTVRKGDLLICEGGDIGRSAIWSEDYEMRIQNHIHRLRPYVEDICVRFYYYVMMYYKNNGLISGRGIGLQGLSSKRLHSILVPLPDIETQYLIAERIDESFSVIDTIDELQQQYSANIEVLKSKIIDAGIHGKLTEQLPEDGTAEELLEQIEIQKNTILKNRKGRVDKKIKAIDGDFPYEIPSHWKWIRFGNIGLFKKGPFGSALTKSMFVPKGENTVKVYEQQHAINKDNTLGTYYITREYFDDSMSGFEVLPGDIIVSCAGTIGETYIMPDDIEQGIINQALMRVTLAEGVNRKFFQYYFDANLKKSAQNESNGSAIKNIPPFDVMKNWYFPIPPLEEQERIVEKIENILTLL